MAEYATKNLARIGVNIKVNTNTWPALLDRINHRQTELWGIAWLADYPDAENFLQLFYGPNAQPGGMNGSYYKNKEFDKLFEKARAMQDSPERTKLYRQLALMISNDCPVVLGVNRIVVGLHQPWIKNTKYSDFMMNSAKYVRVDVDLKKQLRK
jgi:ABC-type transport system substrate-binding protein